MCLCLIKSTIKNLTVVKAEADDAMILKTAKEWYKNRTRSSEFKRFHWWDAVKNQPKGRVKFVGSSSTDP
jgi:hypothetical protein